MINIRDAPNIEILVFWAHEHAAHHDRIHKTFWDDLGREYWGWGRGTLR